MFDAMLRIGADAFVLAPMGGTAFGLFGLVGGSAGQSQAMRPKP
jgi:hypothetical protein